MLLGLITGQRLNDIANMRFSDISDNYLHIKQHKSGSLVRLSLNLRLDAIGMSVSDVVSRCRDRVVSQYLIHHAKNTARRGKVGGIIIEEKIDEIEKRIDVSLECRSELLNEVIVKGSH